MSFVELLSKEWVRLTGMLLIGVTVGALFYPTKHIEEKLTEKHQLEVFSLKEQHSKDQQDLVDKYAASLLENKELKIESERKISKLTEEVKTLQSKQKTAYYKIVRPDGTIEEKQFTESEVNESSRVITQIQEEFKTKVEQIETKWSTIHQERVVAIKKEFDFKESEYKKQIDELSKSKTVTVNQKKFGVEAGVLNDKNFYGHATMDVWGPTFIGVHGELGRDNNASKLGVGLGIRF